MQRRASWLTCLVLGVGLFAVTASADDRTTCADREAAGEHRIRACSRLIASNKLRGDKLGEAYFARARAFDQRGDSDRAIRDYTQALRVKPTIGALLNRGRLFGRKAKYDHAVADFTKAIGMDPDFGLAYAYRGLAYEDMGERDKARADYKRVLNLPDGYANADWARDTARERLAKLPGGE